MAVECEEDELVAHAAVRAGLKLRVPGPLLRLQHAGRELPHGARIGSTALCSGACVAASLRLLGGGGDGGVYPLTHTEMQWMTPSGMGEGGRNGGNSAWTNQTKDTVSEGTLRLDRVMVCAASAKPLKPPIVVCELGYLLNKEDVLELLLSKKLPAHLAHVKSLRAIHDATLHANPSHDPSKGHISGTDDDDPPFHCPVANLPMNGRYPFTYIRSTKHVVSQRALKQARRRPQPLSHCAPAPERARATPQQMTRKEVIFRRSPHQRR